MTDHHDIPEYDRERLIATLIDHQLVNADGGGGCSCGWAEVGARFSVHVAAEYERRAADGRNHTPTERTSSMTAATRDGHVGITGTRSGCTPAQHEELAATLASLYIPGAWLHHGDCIGVDAEAHAIATQLGYRIAVHPPTTAAYRAHLPGDTVHIPKHYADRNQDIVDASRYLIAVPATSAQTAPRSGTWMTWRMGVRAGHGLNRILIQAGRW